MNWMNDSDVSTIADDFIQYWILPFFLSLNQQINQYRDKSIDSCWIQLYLKSALLVADSYCNLKPKRLSNLLSFSL